MKIGIFWGSYDPPHMGHIFAAVQALKTIDVNEVWIVPVFKHPFGKTLTNFTDRMVMCNLAFNGFKSIYVKDLDRDNKTGECLDLLKILHKYYAAEYVMLGGTDVNANNKKHKDIDEILKLCSVARVPRASYTDNKYAIPNYSSSEVKSLAAKGESIEGLVSIEVANFIKQRQLYREEKQLPLDF